MIAELERRTREYFEVASGEPCEHTALDFACAWIENAGTMASLAHEMSRVCGFDLVGGQVATYLRHQFPSESESRLALARAHSAHALSDEAREIVDAPASEQVDVSRAASRARVRHWTAERYNRRDLGSQVAPSVTISIGSLHLDALRAPRAPDQVVSSERLVSDAEDVVITQLGSGDAVAVGDTVRS